MDKFENYFHMKTKEAELRKRNIELCTHVIKGQDCSECCPRCGSYVSIESMRNYIAAYPQGVGPGWVLRAEATV